MLPKSCCLFEFTSSPGKFAPQGSHVPLSPSLAGGCVPCALPPPRCSVPCYLLLMVFQSEINFWRVFLRFRMMGSSSCGREGPEGVAEAWGRRKGRWDGKVELGGRPGLPH